MSVPTIASSNRSYKVGNFSFKAQVLKKFKNYKIVSLSWRIPDAHICLFFLHVLETNSYDKHCAT